MQKHHRSFLLVWLVAFPIVSLVTASKAEMQTESWANSDPAFSDCSARIAIMKEQNLLRGEGVELVDNAGLGYGTTGDQPDRCTLGHTTTILQHRWFTHRAGEH